MKIDNIIEITNSYIDTISRNIEKNKIDKIKEIIDLDLDEIINSQIWKMLSSMYNIKIYYHPTGKYYMLPDYVNKYYSKIIKSFPNEDNIEYNNFINLIQNIVRLFMYLIEVPSYTSLNTSSYGNDKSELMKLLFTKKSELLYHDRTDIKWKYDYVFNNFKRYINDKIEYLKDNIHSYTYESNLTNMTSKLHELVNDIIKFITHTFERYINIFIP